MKPAFSKPVVHLELHTGDLERACAFYAGLWKEHLPKGEALWRAKCELRARRAPTRAWAAWVLTGDAR